MIPEQIIAEGFISYKKRQVIDLRGISVCLINGAINGDITRSNGSGKSALLETFPVNFFGKAGGRANLVDNFINHDCKEMNLEHVFLMDGKRYKKILKKTKTSSAANEVYYDENNKTLEEAQWKLSDKKIEEILGLSCEAFNSVIYLSERETLKFINGTSSERKEILRELLNIIIFENASRKSNKKALNIDKEIEFNLALIKSKQENLTIEGEATIKVDDIKNEIKKLDKFDKEFKEQIKVIQDEKKNLSVEIEKQKDLSNKIIEETKKVKEQEQELNDKQKKLNEIVTAGTNAKKSLESKQQEVKTKKTNLKEIQTLIDKLIKDIEKIKTDIKEIQEIVSSDDKLKLVEELKQKVKEEQEELNSLTKKITEVETKNENVQEYVKKIDKFGKICPIIELECQIITDDYKTKIKSEKEKESAGYEKSIKKNDEKIKQIKESITKHQQDEQKILNEIKLDNEKKANNDKLKNNKQKELDSSNKNLEEVKEEFNKLKLEIKEFDTDIKNLEKTIEEKREYYEQHEEEVEKLKDKVLKAKDAIIGLESKIKKDLNIQLEKKTKQITEIEENIAKTKDLLIEKNNQLVLAKEKEKRIENLKKEIDNFLEKNKKLTSDKEVQLTLTSILGKDGIQKTVMKQAIPMLEETANELLQLFNNGSDSIKIKFELDPKKADGEFKKEGGLDILVIEEGREPKDIVMYSGGETVRIVFSIILALSRLLTKRSGKKHETLIIDEKIAKLDTRGIKQFYDIIKTISEWYEKIFIITHISALKEMFEDQNEIFVNKTDEGSIAEVIK